MFSTLKTEASSILQRAFGWSGSVPFDVPREKEHGDAATSIALQLAKSLKKKPQDIASVLAEGLRNAPAVERADVAGAGYVNVWLTPAALLAELNQSRQAAVRRVTSTGDRPVIVEYSQPNIAKPLGAHHLLSTVIGQAISNLYEHAGYPVIRWNYIGDWGTQFGKLAVAMERWGRKPARECSLDELLAVYVRFHEEAAKDSSLEDAARSAFRQLEAGDPILRAFWSDVVSVTKASLGVIYERLHVRFDLDHGESFYEDKMQPVLEEGKSKRVFTPGKEGSLIVEFPPASGLPPYLVLKGDGATLYSTRDLAQMRYRIDAYGPAAILIVTDVAQKLHFEQLIATCGMLGWEMPAFENVLVGRMRFADKQMSTRTGNILKLDEVLDEAVRRADAVIQEHRESIQTDDRPALAAMMGIGAVAYGILSQNRKMDMVFDWDKMLSFEGNSAPYLQYTHARARSVLRKAQVERDPVLPDTIDVFTDAERSVAHCLLQLPDVLEDARETRMPHKLATHLFELAQAFNAFYNAEPILKAPEPHRTFRLALTAVAASVLKTGAELLTLRVPDRM